MIEIYHPKFNGMIAPVSQSSYSDLQVNGLRPFSFFHAGWLCRMVMGWWYFGERPASIHRMTIGWLAFFCVSHRRQFQYINTLFLPSEQDRMTMGWQWDGNLDRNRQYWIGMVVGWCAPFIPCNGMVMGWLRNCWFWTKSRMILGW